MTIIYRGNWKRCGGIVLSLGVVSVLIVACGRHQEPTGSSFKHDMNSPTNGAGAQQWTGMNQGGFVNVLSGLGIGGTFLDADHTLTERTQYWLDRLDTMIRTEHSRELAGVPRPKAAVRAAKNVNAMVASLPVCLEAGVYLGRTHGAQAAPAAFLNVTTGSLQLWPSQLPCQDGDNADQVVTDFAAAFNGRGGDCRFEVRGSGGKTWLIPGRRCEIADDLDGYDSASKVVLFKTANFVTVHSALMSAMTEGAFVAVLAHELGHYYKAHGVRSPEYGYFYTLGQRNPDYKPTPEPALKSFGEKVIAASEEILHADKHVRFEGQKLRSELFMAAGSIVKGVCRSGSCPSTCARTMELMDHTHFKQAMNLFPFDAEVDTARPYYEAFESRALACFDDLELASDANALTSSKVGWAQVLRAVSDPIWPDWLGQLSNSSKKVVKTMNSISLKKLGTSVPGGGSSLARAMSHASRVLIARDEQGESLLHEALDRRLGQYTSEQEADELAGEWVAELGLDPRFFVEAMHTLMKGSSTKMRGFILGQDECEELYRNGWRGRDGGYAFVPIGNYAEVHHSTCYRMFNLDREIAAHGHTPAQVNSSSAPGGSWSSIQGLAQRISLSEGGGTDDVYNLHSLAQKMQIPCSFAPVGFYADWL